MGAVIDAAGATARFAASQTGTFVITAVNQPAALYRYTLSAAGRYIGRGASSEIPVTVTRSDGSPKLYGGRLLCVTTLGSGGQAFCCYPLSGDTESLTVTVDRDAVKSSLYLINGDFDGCDIPATYALEESKIVPWRDALNFARCLLRHRSAPALPEVVNPQEQSA